MRRSIFLLISIVLLLLFTLPTIRSGRFTFAFDMGRDMLWTRNMVELKKPTLVGPWGSIAGVYFGPLWYYLLAVPYLVTGGDPRGSVLVSLTANIATMITGWIFLRGNKHFVAANVWAFLYATSPLVISISSFAFHANVLPLATLLFMIGLYEGPAFDHQRPGLIKQLTGLPLAALSASFAYHFEPAAGVMLTLFMGLWFLSYFFRRNVLQSFKSLKSICLAIVLFSIPFIPQGVFELRHNFIQSKALVSYVRGTNTSLGGILPLKERVSERVTKLARTASQSFFPIEADAYRWVLLGFFLLVVMYLWRRKRHDRFTSRIALFLFSFVVFHYLAFAFIFPAELKQWYLTGFVVVYLLPLAVMAEKWLAYGGFRSLLVIAFIAFITLRNSNFFTRFSKPAAPAALETLLAQENVVDWMYQDAIERKKPFSVYVYTPPIYDYTYQYLVWWEGTRKYRILPAEFSYLPNETSYLPEKEKFTSTVWRSADARISYLILEPDAMESRRDGWLGHFATYSIRSVQEFPSGVRVEIRNALETPSSSSAFPPPVSSL